METMTKQSSADIEELKNAIRDIPDFPKPGIIFKDITTLLKKPALYQKAVQLMAAPFEKEKIDSVGEGVEVVLGEFFSAV